VNTARFDYPNNMAYLSVAFSSSSDSIYVRVLSNQNAANMTYVAIPFYYDNRDAAVTVTLDDWPARSGLYFDLACSALARARVHHIVAVATNMARQIVPASRSPRKKACQVSSGSRSGS
jgi:hypothetical protein